MISKLYCNDYYSTVLKSLQSDYSSLQFYEIFWGVKFTKNQIMHLQCSNLVIQKIFSDEFLYDNDSKLVPKEF